jgi:hypothetical protein
MWVGALLVGAAAMAMREPLSDTIRMAIVVAVVAAAIGFVFGRYVYLRAEPEDVLTPRWLGNKSPEPEVFARVREGLEAYRAKNRDIAPNDWTVREDPHTGLIETGWFHVHKGEVELKAQIVVWGPLYRVDVWARAWIGGRVRKTWSSRVTEKAIQEEIEKRRPTRVSSRAVDVGR